jgi:putative glutamine amidotransferase
MTPRPIIGITMDAQDNPPAGGRSPTGNSGAYHLAFDYCDAIEKAGGLPLAIPYRTHQALIPQYVDLCDGILFTGGNDLDPALYGEDWHPKAVKVDPDRQDFEMALLAEVERRRTPALFICMGCQVLNVHRGGSLTQFIGDDATKMEHRKGDGDVRRHDVTVDPNSTLGKAVGRQAFSTNTYHKQAVKTVGKGLKVVATAPDGTVEALEDASFPFMLATQWHPERLTDEPEHFAPFKLLVEKAAGTVTPRST